MKYAKNLAVLLFSIFFMCLIACDGSDDKPKSTTQNVIRVGTSPDYPPFEMYESGQIVGFDIDVINGVGKEMGVEIKVQEMAFDSLMPSLISGKVDAVISSVTKTKERAAQIDFSDNYHSSNIALLVKEKSQYTNLDELVGKTVGVQSGSIMEKYLNAKKDHLNISVFSVSSNLFLIEELKLDRIDAILFEGAQARSITQKNNSFKFYDLEALDDGYAIAVQKGSKLKDRINTALYALQKSGELDRIKQKWLNRDE